MLPTCPQGGWWVFVPAESEPCLWGSWGWNGMSKSLLSPHFGPRREAVALCARRSVVVEAGHEASWALTCRQGAPRFPIPLGTWQRAPLGAEGLSFLSLSFPLSPRRPDKYMQGPSWLHLWPGQNDVSSFPGILLQRSLHPGLCLTRMAGERRGMVRPDPADPCRPCCPCLPVGGWPWPRNALWFPVKQCRCGGRGREALQRPPHPVRQPWEQAYRRTCPRGL